MPYGPSGDPSRCFFSGDGRCHDAPLNFTLSLTPTIDPGGYFSRWSTNRNPRPPFLTVALHQPHTGTGTEKTKQGKPLMPLTTVPGNLVLLFSESPAWKELDARCLHSADAKVLDRQRHESFRALESVSFTKDRSDTVHAGGSADVGRLRRERGWC
ncbi:hypothetical protein BDV59DRAFT_96549 [Aspergillus ambiguus]|uniref:uncharacterized protein n=1 Tax=Aspergillus ambiguus TaxID=176160 RepID=UPI003CCD533E